MKKFLFPALLALVAAGCHGQIPPPTTHVVNLTITAPAGCTSSSPCTYAIYRCSASATACADTTNTAWAEITNSANRISGTSYTDSSAAGLTAFYAAAAYQGAGHSGASNIVGPFVVPASPLAPIVNGSTAQAKEPLQAIDPGSPQVATLDLKAVLR